MASSETFFKRLTRLFRSGPAIRRKIKGYDYKAFYDKDVVSQNYGYGPFPFKREQNPFSVLGAYGLLDRLARYSEFCFHPDTLIYTIDKGVLSIKELAEKYPEEIIHCYAYDHNKKEIGIATAHHPRITKEGKSQKLIEITFDDDGKLKTTLDHKFLLRDGTYIEAKDLKINNSLMPFYMRKVESNYHHIYLAKNNRNKNDFGWKAEHILIAEYFVGRTLNENEVVHHIDFNCENNHPSNLKIMDEFEHKKYHSKLNNKNKLNKKNISHSNWMKNNNPIKRNDITFSRIFDVATAVDFSLSKTSKLLEADINVIKRRLREEGFDNWLDFKENKGLLTKLRISSKILEETQLPTLEKIIEIASKTNNIYEASRLLGITDNTLKRTIKRYNLGTWSEVTGKPFDPGQSSKDSELDNSLTYQMICSVYQKGDTKISLAEKLKTTSNKILTRIEREGFISFSDWTETFENHKIKEIKFLEEESVVYNITVDGNHNLAVGSLNTSVSKDKRPYSMVIVAQSEMEYTGEIATGLNIWSDEVCSADDKGKSFHIFSDNPDILKNLEELFYDVVNIEFNLRPWVRNLVKYGDFFLYNEVAPDIGIVNVVPIPVNEVEREEGFDTEDPYAVRFKWISRGQKVLENWQVTHIRMLGNDLFLPYGTSLLESARKVWRQLCLHGNTSIYTKNGYKPIKDIKIGDEIYSFDYEKNKLIETKVKHCVPMGKQKIFEIKTNRTTIKATENHGFLVYTKDKKYEYKRVKDLIITNGLGGQTHRNADRFVNPLFDFPDSNLTFLLEKKLYSVWLTEKKKVENLSSLLKNIDLNQNYKEINNFLNGHKKISYVIFDKLKNVIDFDIEKIKIFCKNSKIESVANKKDLSFTITKDFMRFFGFMFGDGWIGNKTNKTNIGFALGICEQENEYYVSLFKDLFKKDLHISSKKEEKSKQANTSSKEIHSLFKNALGFHTGFKIKRIPSWIYKTSPEFKQEFIKGLFDADGCDKDGRISLSNKELLEDVKVLCNECGIPTGNEVKLDRSEGEYIFDKKTNRKCHRQTSYRLYVNLNKISNDTVKYNSIISVKELDEDETYDLEVDHPIHNFIAEGVVSHNTMIEDSMLTYRIVRSPERRVFYVDVSNVPPNEIPNYMEQVKASMRSNTAVDRTDGRLDYRYKPVAIDDDYFIPVRGDRQATKIESLAGGQHVSAVEDVEYIHKKLVSALMIPAAYLGYDDSLSSKATLAMEDIRFSRTVNIIQKTIIAELNKLAILHLYAKGFDGEDLIDFELRLSNPSSVAMQQKLTLWKTRFEIADQAKGTELVDSDFIRKEILGLTDGDVKKIDKGLERDKIRALALDDMKLPQESPPAEADPFDQQNYHSLPGGGSVNGSGNGGKPETEEEEEAILLPGGDNEINTSNLNVSGAPIKASPYVQRRRRQNARSVEDDGISATSMPNFNNMLNTSNKSLKDIYDDDFLGNPLSEEVLVREFKPRRALTTDIQYLINCLQRSSSFKKSNVLSENLNKDVDEDVQNQDELEELGLDLKS